MKLLFLLLLLSLPGKEPSDNGISYRTLSWSDFRGAVPENETSVAARSVTQLELETTELEGKFTFVVRATFLPDSSFVRVRTEQVLRHEQTHFQIAYIMALKCMHALEPFQGGNATKRVMAVKIYHEFYRRDDKLNDQFDLETDHALNEEIEEDWERRMTDLLNLLAYGRSSKNP